MKLLAEWTEVAEMMRPEQIKNRVNTLTMDTSAALKWTCSALIDLSCYLLTTVNPWKHDWVPLGLFQQDDIEKHFGHFRMSAGCNFYITVKDIVNIQALDRAKTLLKICPDLEQLSQDDSHNCRLCDKPLCSAELRILDQLLEDSAIRDLPLDSKMAIFYISGYVAFKNPELRGSSEEAPSEIKTYFTAKNRGGLSMPSMNLVDFMFLVFSFFKTNVETSCRNRLVGIFSRFSHIFHIDIIVSEKALKTIANILLKCQMRQANSHKDLSKKERNSKKVNKVSSKNK